MNWLNYRYKKKHEIEELYQEIDSLRNVANKEHSERLALEHELSVLNGRLAAAQAEIAKLGKDLDNERNNTMVLLRKIQEVRQILDL